MSEASEELKKEIRLKRAIDIVENHKNLTPGRIYSSYYKTRKDLSLESIISSKCSLTIKFSLKGIKEDAIDDFKNETTKRNCLYLLIQVFPVNFDTLKSFMSREKSAEEYLLFTYRCFLESQINYFNPIYNYKDKTVDELEDFFDEVISKREAEKDSKIEAEKNKQWWNVF